MTTSQTFSGLTMPVFTAFGWAGQEAAVEFALEQLEQFVRTLQVSLPRTAQSILPHAGLNRTDQSVYLAANEDVDSDIHVSFIARPVSLEMQLILADKKALAKGLKFAEKQPALAHRLITELGADWSFRLQQMQVDEDSGEASHYQDMFKESVTQFDESDAADLLSKAAYLNNEDKWITPLYVSQRFNSERISAMGLAVVDVIGKEIEKLVPLIEFLTGHKGAKPKRSKKSRTRSKTKKRVVATEDVGTEKIIEIDPEVGFNYTAEIKPLFLRKGFVNLTDAHWPFFAVNSRTETRGVTVYYEGVYDKDSTVWHIQSNGLARLVLSHNVHTWFEENFEAGDYIQLAVKKLDDNEIQVSLRPLEEE